jgi:hypothetical protein
MSRPKSLNTPGYALEVERERDEAMTYAVSMEQAFASLATSHELGRKWEAEETIRYAATLMHPKPLVVNGKAVETKMEKPAPTACDKCDGTGWTEGGEGNALGAKCGFCKGFGVAPYQGDVDLKKPPKTRHAIDIRQLVSHLRAANPQVALKAADEAADLIERRILSQGQLPEPIGEVSAPSGTLPYKHLVRYREPRDDEVGMKLYAFPSQYSVPARYCQKCKAHGDAVGEVGSECWTKGCDGQIAAGTR